MPSYPRLTQVTNVFQAPQTFDNSITINGIKCRPVQRTVAGVPVIAWQQEVNGTFMDVASRENPTV
jgi:glutaredoxin 2